MASAQSPLGLGGHPFLAGLGSALAGRQYAEAICDEDPLLGPNEKWLTAWRNTPLSRSPNFEAIAR